MNPADHTFPPGWRFSLALLVLGGTALIFQVVLFREFLAIFYGSELVVGCIFAGWLVLTAAGAFLGRFIARWRSGPSLLPLFFLLNGLLPGVTVFSLRVLRNIVFDPGGMIGLGPILESSILLMAPFCLISGILFVLLAGVQAQRGEPGRPARAYAAEAAGSILGGLLYNLLLVFIVTTFQSLLVLFIVNLCTAFLLAARGPIRGVRYVLPVLLMAGIAVMLIFDVDRLSRERLFPDQDLLGSRDTPSGCLTVTRQGEQTNFFDNGILLFSTDQTELNEEIVHYAMAQRPGPRNVLTVGAGLTGAAGEILKYDVVQIDDVEIDPWLAALGRTWAPPPRDPRIHIFTEDVRMYIRRTTVLYDVVLLNSPEPSTILMNRCFTFEFFRDLKKILRSGGIVSAGLVDNVDYYGPDARRIASTLCATLGSVFRNVVIVPGLTKNYFLASDSTLADSVTGLVAARGIPTVYVNRYYLDDRTLHTRGAELRAALRQDAPLNEDYNPVTYADQTALWLSYAGSGGWLILPAVALLILVLARPGPLTTAMFLGGFAASSAELLLLIAFQVVCGYLYQAIGLVVTVFMTGLAAGSVLGIRIARSGRPKLLPGVQLFLTGYAALIPAVLAVSRGVHPGIFAASGALFILTIIDGILAGILFAVVTSYRSADPAGSTSHSYAADLLGSAAGAVLLPTLFIRLLGLIGAGAVIAAVCGMGAVLSLIRRNYS